MFDDVEGEISRRREKRVQGKERGGRRYVLGLGAENICCAERSRGQGKFSSDWALEYPSPQAERLANHQRHEVMLL